MNDQDWARVVRLYEQHKAAKSQHARDMLEDAIDRELRGIARGKARTGSLETAKDNFRRRERHRAMLDGELAPLIAAANDPWPAIDRRIDRERAIERERPPTRQTLRLLIYGLTYAEASLVLDTSVGTLKARVSRAKKRIVA